MISTSSIVVSLSLAAVSLAQSIPSGASAQQLAIVAGQYNASRLGEVSNVGLGVPASNLQALVTVVYPTAGVVTNGQAYPASGVNAQPAIYLTPASGVATQYGTSNRFTVVLADAGAVGSPDPRFPNGNYRHYLANGVPGAVPSTGTNTTFALSGGNVVTAYAGPGPAEGEGPHRYAWLVFQQPSSFAAPADLTGTQPAGAWNVTDYVRESNLGQLVGTAFFTVENGQASYTVAPTSAVNSVAASLYPNVGGTSTSSDPTRPTSSGSPASGGGSTGAASIVKVVSGAVLGLAGFAAVMAAYL